MLIPLSLIFPPPEYVITPPRSAVLVVTSSGAYVITEGTSGNRGTKYSNLVTLLHDIVTKAIASIKKLILKKFFFIVPLS
jgi:hypothetical protein